MRSLFFLSVLVGTAAAAPVSAQTYDPIKKPTDGKFNLGWELEERFTQYMGTCGVAPMKMTKGLWGTKTISAIDGKLFQALKLQNSVEIEKPLGVGLGRFFGYIYPDSEKNNPQWYSTNFLPVNYSNDSKFIQAFGFPQATFSSSCGSVVSVALDASAGYSFSIVALKAAFDAESKTDNRATLELSKGVYDSPIWSMWSATSLDTKRSNQKFYSAMLFWDWYNSAARTVPYSILTTVRGTSFHRQLTSKNSQNGGGSFEISGGIPFVTATGKVSGRSNSDRLLEVQDFEIFIDKQVVGAPPVLQWQPMPSVSDVVNAIQQYADVSEPKLDNLLPITTGQSRRIAVDIEGLPFANCESNQWNILDNSTASLNSSVLSILSVSRSQEPGSTICHFVFVYNAGNVTVGGDVILNPVLASKKSLDNKRATIPLKQFNLPTTTNPNIAWLTGNPRAAISKIAGSNPAQYDLVWTVDIKVIDNGRYPNINQIKTGQLGLKCPANVLTLGDATFDPTLVGVTSADSKTVRLTGRAKFEGGDINAEYAYEVCSLDGPISFEETGYSAVSRQSSQMNVTLYYPKRVAPQPPLVGPAVQ